MSPDQWLELIRKDALDPNTTSFEDFNLLRTNYFLWTSALDHLKDIVHEEKKSTLRTRLGHRYVEDHVWKSIIDGCPDPSIDHALALELQEIRRYHNDLLDKIKLRIAKVRFYKQIDKYTERQTGQLAPEVQDSLWRQKYQSLHQAIEAHRRSYVLANKQPNGLDHALWATADLPEFHASRLGIIQRKVS